MQTVIEVMYIVGALIAISACIPQLRQLVVSKASDELSLSTWVVWLAVQCITLLYVTSIGNALMMTVNIGWVVFYAVMVGLIIRYRHLDKPEPALVPEEQTEAY